MSSNKESAPKPRPNTVRGGIPGAIRDTKIINALLDDKPIPETDNLSTAPEYVRLALKLLALAHCNVELAFASNAIIEFFPEDHKEIETAAVYLDGEGVIRLAFNIGFIKRNPPLVIQFAIIHEMHHLWLAHLYSDKELGVKDEPRLWTHAAEAVVNDRCSKLMRGPISSSGRPINRGILNFVSPAFKTVTVRDYIPEMLMEGDVETSPIRPVDTYEAVKDVLKEAGRAYPTYQEFVASDMACFCYLKEAKDAFKQMTPQQQQQLAGPPPTGEDASNNKSSSDSEGDSNGNTKDGSDDNQDSSTNSSSSSDGKDFSWCYDQPPSNGTCSHAGGASGGEDGRIQGTTDPSVAKDKVEEILSDLLQEAINGNKDVKASLEDFFDKVVEDGAKIWGKIPMNILRSHPTTEQKVTWWLTYLMHTLTSLLVDGERLAVNRKIASWSDTPIQPIGKEEHRAGAIFIDTSGSMSSAVLKKLTNLVGSIPDTEVTWFNFDADVVPLEVGAAFAGGGGTDFGVINQKVQEMERVGDNPLDFVIVVTDGYAPPIEPQDPSKWIWLITKGGKNWPADYGMRSTVIDELE